MLSVPGSHLQQVPLTVMTVNDDIPHADTALHNGDITCVTGVTPEGWRIFAPAVIIMYIPQTQVTAVQSGSRPWLRSDSTVTYTEPGKGSDSQVIALSRTRSLSLAQV